MKILPSYVLVVALACGCIATHEVKPLGHEEYEALESSVQQMLYKPHYRPDTGARVEIAPDSWPAEVRKLHPISVYIHVGSVCIAIARDGKEEKGYCVMSINSSVVPTVETNGWVWKQASDMVFLYNKDLTKLKADE